MLEAVTEVQFPVRKRPFLTAISSDKELKPMEPEIIKKPAFDVVGMLYHGHNQNNEIAGVWDEFIPRLDEVLHKTTDSYGVCSAVEVDGRFKYLACYEVSKVGDLPDNMKHWTVPAQTYAAFPCTLQNIRETFDHAYKNWLPKSGYQPGSGVDLEYYPPEFRGGPADRMYVYIPVVNQNS